MVKCALPLVVSEPGQQHKKPRSRKIVSLIAKVEQATDIQSPADALIRFASQLSGTSTLRNLEAASTWRAACRGIQPDGSRQVTRRSSESNTGLNARAPGAKKQHSIDRWPRSCFTPEPCWTPQPGSRTYLSLTHGIRKARYYANCVPSVRAYSPVLGIEEQSEDPIEEVAVEADIDEAVERLSEASAKEASQRSFGKKVPDEESQSANHSLADSDEVVKIAIPWTEAELQNVFRKFSDDHEHEVQTEDLQSLLRYLGARPSSEELQGLIREQTNYASLDWFEFLEFIRRYREHDMEQLLEEFHAADIDGNGNLDFEELHTLLSNTGFSPTKEATQEALDTIDADNDGTISFNEFEQLREHLRISRGFLRSEAEELRMLFRRVSRVQQGLPVDELWRVCAYIGYQVSREEIRKITIQVDRDGSGTINFDELLEIIRAVREQEGEKLLKVILANETAGAFQRSGSKVSRRDSRLQNKQALPARSALRKSVFSVTGASSEAQSLERSRAAIFIPERKATITIPRSLPIKDVQPVLHCLGYFASSEIIKEILADHLPELADRSRLSWEEMKWLLRCYRRAEGFTKNELDFLRLCFDREQTVSVAGDDAESLDALELGRVLRNFGISKTLQQVQRFIEEIDFDGSGQVEFGEFTKLMRQIFHKEAQLRHDVFASLEFANDGWMPAENLEKAMAMVSGGAPDEEMVRLAKQDSGLCGQLDISAPQFERFFTAYRKLLIESVREHAGFVPSEVEMLRDVFDSHDGKGDGILQPAEMRNLILELVPEASESAEGKQKFLQILEELTPQGNTDLDFPMFLRLMRKCHDQRDELDIVREQEVTKHCEYSPEEVEGLRQIFSSNTDCFGEITLEALAKIFRGIITLSDRTMDELAYHLRENVLGINDAASRVNRRQELRGTFSTKKVDKKLSAVSESSNQILMEKRLSAMPPVNDQSRVERKLSAMPPINEQSLSTLDKLDNRQPPQRMVLSDLSPKPARLMFPS